MTEKKLKENTKARLYNFYMDGTVRKKERKREPSFQHQRKHKEGSLCSREEGKGRLQKENEEKEEEEEEEDWSDICKEINYDIDI